MAPRRRNSRWRRDEAKRARFHAKRHPSFFFFFSEADRDRNAMPDRRTKATIVEAENQKRRDHFRPQSMLEFEGRAPASSVRFLA